MILESWETRWFGEGAVPLPLQQWSEENNLKIQPLRTDHYLLNNAGKIMGIKWREGSLQIKELITQTDDVPPLEHYKKWSFELEKDELQNRIEGRNEWIAVTKKRDMAKWRINGGEIEKVELGYEEENGFELEISSIICKEKLWWSVAFEATGGKDNLILALNEVKLPVGENAVCMGYAEWLDVNFNYGD